MAGRNSLGIVWPLRRLGERTPEGQRGCLRQPSSRGTILISQNGAAKDCAADRVEADSLIRRRSVGWTGRHRRMLASVRLDHRRVPDRAFKKP
jgi:hypothetical protein